MINLVLTTDKLQVVTGSAATVDVHASWVDLSGTTVTPGKTNTAISSATTTDVVAAPASSTSRNIKTLLIRNKDASLTVDITVVFDANGTDYEMHKVTLNTGELLEYVEGVGFFTITQTAKLNVLKYVTADSVHATAATFADITGLTQAVKSGLVYAVEAHLFTTNDASTTGTRFGYNIGAAPTLAIFGNYSVITNAVSGPTFGIGTATARDTAITLMTTGQTATGHHILGGFVIPSADGTFALRAASEVTVANGLVVKKGSWMTIRQTDN